MQYIAELFDNLTDDQKEIVQRHCTIVYESRYLPLIGVQTNNPRLISGLDFVKSVRIPDEGNYQDGAYLSSIIFEPPVKKGILVNNKMLGWGDTRIAVLDSGVSSDISLTDQFDFTKTGIRDGVSHGTVVTKIIKHFAKGSNIYFAKVGTPKPNELYVMQGLEWAAEKGVKFINISAGFDRKTPCDGTCMLCKLVDKISNTGVAVIVAAGNNDNALNSIDCPGVSSEAITVGAIDKNRKIASYSSFGKKGGNKPNIVAPGNLYIDAIYRNGTSFAAPLVTGILGAIYNHVGSVSKCMELVYRTSDDLGVAHHMQGVGCINIDRLVEEIINATVNTDGSGQK